MKITAGTTLKQILEKKGSEKVLAKYKVPCLSCPLASLELDKLELGQVCEIYGLPLKEILNDLNK